MLCVADNLAIKLIVGLGNPGAEHDQTRHNAGFWFVDELARRYQGVFRHEAKFSGDICRIHLAGHDVWLLKPTTYMNRSGQALKQMSGFYKIPLQAVLVVHDEIDLPPGQVKLKRGGGHGGHNGLRDVFAHCGKDFWRLRIGVGHPGHRDQVVDYVLARPSKSDATVIMQNIDEAASLAAHILAGDFEKAMRELHSRHSG